MRNHSHNIERAVERLHELQHTADVGQSPKTLSVILGEVSFVAAVVVAAILAISLLAYRLAS
jgi:hypothetical protein